MRRVNDPAAAPVRSAYRLLDRRHEHWILASMLLVLHAALDGGLDDASSTALMTTHLGLFFLWQPIWQRDQQLDPRATLFIALIVGGMLLLLSWWTLFAWLVILIGIVAGRSFSTRQERYIYMVSLAVLISELLVVCTPPLFLTSALPPVIAQAFRLGIYLAPALIYAVPPQIGPQREPFPVDFIRGITFALMTALLAVFSVLITLRLDIDYPLALVATLIALGLLLLFLSWITTPGGGGIGLLAVWEKSVLNIGTPFEAWLGNIANLARQRAQAEDFLEAAIEELADIPWISAVDWHTEHASGIEGQRTSNHLTVETDSLRITLHTERSFSSALLIHCRLLIQVLGHFYAAKLRENEEANEAHLRAIYETGARVTHDIKNLLQSLRTLADTLQGPSSANQEQRSLELLKRRLPDIAERLALALDRLQKPRELPQTSVSALDWWQQLRARHADEAIRFGAAPVEGDAGIPGECFDSVTDNLLQNACTKLGDGGASKVEVEMEVHHGRVRVLVSDDGPAIEPDLARALLRRPVPSANGLGIGLYQAARQARDTGCELRLAENRAGRVCFELVYRAGE